MNFLGHALAREYDKDNGPLLYLFILDANNFHHPKACIGGAGFDSQDLQDIKFKLPNHTWKAKAIYFSNGTDGFLTVYWICINKKQVNWADQKLIQLWYSIFHKQKDGFMVRLDIHANKDQIPRRPFPLIRQQHLRLYFLRMTKTMNSYDPRPHSPIATILRELPHCPFITESKKPFKPCPRLSDRDYCLHSNEIVFFNSLFKQISYNFKNMRPHAPSP